MKEILAIVLILNLMTQLLVFLYSWASITEHTGTNRDKYCRPLNRDISTVPELAIRAIYIPSMLLACLATYPIDWRKE